MPPDQNIATSVRTCRESIYEKIKSVSVCVSVCLCVPSEFLRWFLHGDQEKYKCHMNSYVKIFSCEGISHPIISFVQDLSYWIPTWDTYEHSPKQKPNRKPSFYYKESYVETFANTSAETFAEKETKTVMRVSVWATSTNISGPGFKYFTFLFILYWTSQAKSSQPKSSQPKPSGPKPTQAINFGNHL